MNNNPDSNPSDLVVTLVEDPKFQNWVLRPDQHSEDFWRDWIAKHPATYPQIKEARRILLDINSPAYRLDEAAIQDVWKNIQQEIKPSKLLIRANRTSRQKSWVWVAACFLFVLGLSSYFFLEKESDQVNFRTGYGETLTLLLPDSSSVILNANSTLSYLQGWNSHSIREVWVSGEAYFDVKHLDTHQPFKVYPASGIEVEVLGTQFNIYQRNKQTKVLLSEGNVTMSIKDRPQESKILMKPGDLVEYDQKKIQKKRVNPESYVSWTKKVLQLESTTLEEMIRMAEENYGLQVQVGSQVNLSQSASGSMPLTDGTSFMSLTAKIFHVQIEYRDSVYYIQ